jgi:hypothetical protein
MPISPRQRFQALQLLFHSLIHQVRSFGRVALVKMLEFKKYPDNT